MKDIELVNAQLKVHNSSSVIWRNLNGREEMQNDIYTTIHPQIKNRNLVFFVFFFFFFFFFLLGFRYK